jgi:carbon monoxide dehydrogenase subunit G
MLIKNTFEVAEPLEKVWDFFGNVPQVAACLPGAELTDDLGNDEYAGTVGVRMGPVRMSFAGKAKVLERDEAAKRMVIDGAGADQKGRGQAAMTITAQLASAGSGTRVSLDQDLQLSGAAAQYGRGMIQDVTTVLMGQFAQNMQQRIGALERGESLDGVGAQSASGFAIGLQAARLALMRVFRRFFLPYRSSSYQRARG